MIDPNVIVEHVDVYPYPDEDPGCDTGPAVLPVVTGGQGTFVAEPCAAGWSLTLDIIGGSVVARSIGGLVVGRRYVARMTGRHGECIVSPTLTCTGDDGVGQIFAGVQTTDRCRPCDRAVGG